MGKSLTCERGVFIDRGYVFILFWPWGRKNKPHRQHFGPATPENITLANYKMREYRNKISMDRLDIEKPAVPMLFKDAGMIFVKKHKAHLLVYIRRLNMYFGDYFLHNITPQMVKDFRKTREAEGVSFATVNKDQAILSSVFERFGDWNALGGVLADRVKLPAENPCRHIAKPSEIKRARKRRLTPEEWLRLNPKLANIGINHKGLNLEAGWLLDIAKMALHSSLRLKDILELSGKSIVGDVLIGLQAKNADKGKTYQVPLTESLRRIAMRIAARPRVNGWIVQKYFREACEEAGIKDVTIRDLRRTGLSWLDSHGISRTGVRDRAGHSDAKTTELYLGSDDAEQLEAIQKLEDTFK